MNSSCRRLTCFVTGPVHWPLATTRSQSRAQAAVSEIRMGRRSEKIKNRKEAQTRARTKDFARVGKQIAIAVKNGGTDTTTNKALADALDAAKAVSFPKETIERTIARATSSDQADYKASSFEIYGHGGVGIYVDVLTDNSNRAAAEIRAIANKQKMKIGSPGSVAYNFERTGVLRIVKENVADADDLLMAAIDAGADECEVDPQDSEVYRISVSVENLQQTRKALADSGYNIDSSRPEMVPKTLTEISETDADKNFVAIEQLEGLDDVDSVATNMKIEDR